MHVISESKEKVTILIITLVSFFLAFEASSIAIHWFQVDSFLIVAFAVYFYLVFLVSFIFDIHLKRSRDPEVIALSVWESFKRRFGYLADLTHYLHFQNYLILPGVIYWGTITLLYLNPFDVALKQSWIILSTLALAVVFWYLKTVFYDHKEVGWRKRQLIFLVKVYAVYLIYAASFGLMRFLGFDPWAFSLLIFTMTFLLLYQAMFQHHFIGFQTIKYLMLISGFMALLGALVFTYWNVNYFSGALVLTAVYNTIWGLTHHKFMDRDLTRVIVYEYLAILFLILVLVFSMTNFTERI